MRTAVRRWLGRVPLLAPALAAAAGLVAVDADPRWWAAAAVAGLLALVADGWRGLSLSLLAVVVIGGGHGWRLAAARRIDASALGGNGRADLRIEGTVSGRPEVRGGGWVALVDVGRIGTAGAGEVAPWGRVWWLGRGQPPLPGSRLVAEGLAWRPEAPRNPGEHDFGGWLRRQLVWAVFDGRSGAECVPPPPWRRRLELARLAFRRAIVHGLDPERREVRVIRAMVLGERPRSDDELIDAFRNSGSLHVFAVSGLHVGLVGLCVWVVLRLLRVPRRWAIPLLVAAMFSYAWLAGLRAPAVRAAWMAALLLGGFLIRRPGRLLNLLSVVAIGALAWDGHQLFLAGFQLSYVVVATIALLGAAFARRLGDWPAVDPYLPRALWSRRHEWQCSGQRWLTGSLGVSLAAWCGSAPLVGWHFRLFTPVAPLASLLLLPLVTVVLVSGMSFGSLGAAAVAPISPAVAARINRVYASVAGVSVGVAEWAAALPGSHWRLPDRGASGGELVVFDLDYGAAAHLFDPGSGKLSLLDCGDTWSFERTILPRLLRGGRPLGPLILSHPDSGHLGGAVSLLDASPPERVLLPVERARSPSFRRLVGLAPARKLPLDRMAAGESIVCSPEARWEVVQVAPDEEWDALADDRCAVLRLHWHGWRVLFLSDTGFVGEQRLCAAVDDLAADVLVLGRHRMDPGCTGGFLAAVAPRVVVVSHDRFPPEERVDERMLAKLHATGARVFHQGESGAVIINAGRERLELRGFLGGEVVLER